MPQNRIMVLTAISGLFCLCLIFAGGLGLGLGLKDTVDKVTSRRSAIAAAEPSPLVPPERPISRGRLLLADDFSQEHWRVSNDNGHRKGYADGRYFITVDVQQYNYWSLAGESYQDFVLEVETMQIDGPLNNDYGVILRHQDDANFYSFEISSDGFYSFTKLVDDELFAIIPWQQSDAINQGQSNTLRIETVGPNFSFYINDELVDAAIDSTFDQGDIGLVVGTNQEAGTHIAFDNLKVWAVE